MCACRATNRALSNYDGEEPIERDSCVRKLRIHVYVMARSCVRMSTFHSCVIYLRGFVVSIRLGLGVVSHGVISERG